MIIFIELHQGCFVDNYHEKLCTQQYGENVSSFWHGTTHRVWWAVMAEYNFPPENLKCWRKQEVNQQW